MEEKTCEGIWESFLEEEAFELSSRNVGLISEELEILRNRTEKVQVRNQEPAWHSGPFIWWRITSTMC